MTKPPAPSELARPQTAREPLAAFSVYRSGAKVTMRCQRAGCQYAKTWPGTLQLNTLVNLAEQHHREQHASRPMADDSEWMDEATGDE